MSRSSKGWRPKGKTPDKILESVLSEAAVIIDQFEKITDRHRDEIEAYRAENPWNTGGKDIERWKQETLLKKLFEIAKPDEFDYNFHERRRIFLDQLEVEEDINLGSTFVDVCVLSGIKPLILTIVNAHEFQRHIYNATDPRSPPEFDPATFDLLEFDVTLLRMFVDASKFYGADQLLVMFTQKYNSH